MIGKPHTVLKDSKKRLFLYLPKKIYNYLFFDATRNKEKKDILIFDHARKINFSENFIDPYTYYYEKEIKDKSYEVIERDYLGKHYLNCSNTRSYNDYFPIVDYLRRELSLIKLNADEKKLIINLEKKISITFKLKTELRLLSFAKKHLIKFLSYYKYYDKLLRIKRPEIIVMVTSYGKYSLIAAAKKNSIKTIEIQHGTMSKYHLGYSFPNNKTVPYFPDELYMFGKYWYDSTPIPLPEEKLTYYGFPYMEEQLKQYKNKQKKKNQVLFLSQGTIGKKLSEIAFQFAKKNKEYKIIYKLHPGEYDRWRNEYPDLVQADKLNHFQVIDNNERNLYELLSESEYQIGVYSTAIFEGLVLGCKTILCHLYGIEYMEYLIDKGYAKLAESAEDITRLLHGEDFKAIDKEYFFKTPQNLENIIV